ncbi:hypothetical protein IAT38_005933 [Cryptococcus sp. DSM 104549]
MRSLLLPVFNHIPHIKVSTTTIIRAVMVNSMTHKVAKESIHFCCGADKGRVTVSCFAFAKHSRFFRELFSIPTPHHLTREEALGIPIVATEWFEQEPIILFVQHLLAVLDTGDDPRAGFSVHFAELPEPRMRFFLGAVDFTKKYQLTKLRGVMLRWVRLEAESVGAGKGGILEILECPGPDLLYLGTGLEDLSVSANSIKLWLDRPRANLHPDSMTSLLGCAPGVDLRPVTWSDHFKFRMGPIVMAAANKCFVGVKPALIRAWSSRGLTEGQGRAKIFRRSLVQGQKGKKKGSGVASVDPKRIPSQFGECAWQRKEEEWQGGDVAMEVKPAVKV